MASWGPTLDSSEDDGDPPWQERQPERNGGTLVVYFPVPPAIECCEPGCGAIYSPATWTSRRQSVPSRGPGHPGKATFLAAPALAEGHLLLLLTGGDPFLDVWRGRPADLGGLGRPGWPWRPPDVGRRSVARSCPFWFPGTTPFSATSARDSGFPRGGPFIAGVNCFVLVGICWFRSTGVFTPYRPGATTPADPGRRLSVGLPPGPGGAAVSSRRLQHEVQRGHLDVSRAVGEPPRRIRARRSCERSNLRVLGVRLAAHVPALVPPLFGHGHARAFDGDASPSLRRLRRHVYDKARPGEPP
ncbi:hypothetical protein HPB51_001331 [Rhipicephalus microplus]|uniref:Uncharacterized protein n=1 Tax=Rhipicephalus microplus TaxID=6941 RepID=A0A9J6DZ71_RHIMP|nr:hypothetical protein HPB51_001331 [Rhipicephalus microplus]